jgi:hypothetical protein
MNKHILLVMTWLSDKESVSQEELKDNAADAYAAADYAGYAGYAYYTAYYDAYRAACYAAYAAYHAGGAGDYAATAAVDWVDKFFKVADENKDDYIAEISK